MTERKNLNYVLETLNSYIASGEFTKEGSNILSKLSKEVIPIGSLIRYFTVEVYVNLYVSLQCLQKEKVLEAKKLINKIDIKEFDEKYLLTIDAIDQLIIHIKENADVLTKTRTFSIISYLGLDDERRKKILEDLKNLEDLRGLIIILRDQTNKLSKILYNIHTLLRGMEFLTIDGFASIIEPTVILLKEMSDVN